MSKKRKPALKSRKPTPDADTAIGGPKLQDEYAAALRVKLSEIAKEQATLGPNKPSDFPAGWQQRVAAKPKPADIIAARVHDAIELREDMLVYLRQLSSGEQEPCMVIKDKLYGDSPMSKTFISVPQQSHAKAVEILRRAYIEIIHIVVNDLSEVAAHPVE